MYTPLFLEILASVLGMGYIVLISKKQRIGWVLGILSCGAFAAICFENQLLEQGIVQMINALFGLYAYFTWRNANIEVHSKPNYAWVLLVLTPMLVAVSFLLFQKLPWHKHLDHSVLGLTLVATWLTLRVVRENWFYWLVINALTLSR